jgi:predicted RNA binding protein YcfA (HicA-like mRNA interferase family)
VTRSNKLYARIVNNPKDVNYEQLDKLLLKYGFERSNPGTGSSHYTYRHPELVDILTIPFKRPVKAIYVKQAIAAIKQLKQRSE